MVGAGPHALTCVLSLLAADRALAGRIVVADPQPWLHAWQEQLARLDLRLLRSSCVHHPHPSPYALVEAASAAGDGPARAGPEEEELPRGDPERGVVRRDLRHLRCEAGG